MKKKKIVTCLKMKMRMKKKIKKNSEVNLSKYIYCITLYIVFHYSLILY
jgi:hypothetical protein